MPQKPVEHERIDEHEARAKLQGIGTDQLTNLQAKMHAKNPPEKKSAEDDLPKGLLKDLKRERRNLGPVHSAAEAFGHISAAVKELELCLGERNRGLAQKLIRKIACVALCSETWSKE